MGLFGKAKEMAASAASAAGDMAMQKVDEAKQEQIAKAERKELDRQAKDADKVQKDFPRNKRYGRRLDRQHERPVQGEARIC